MPADTISPVIPDIEAVTSAYRNDQRIHGDGSPWVMMNMIASIDGAISIDGVSGGLGNDADFAVFMTLRNLADVILVAAGTARAEGYRAPKLATDIVGQRHSRGQRDRPTIAVVTRSLRLDLDGPLFSETDYRPAVVTVEAADRTTLTEVEKVADVMLAGQSDVNMGQAVRELGARYGPVVLVEGGPTLNGQLAAADLLHELCVTVSPKLVGGTSGRMLANAPVHDARQYELDRAMPAGGLLFTRYLRH